MISKDLWGGGGSFFFIFSPFLKEKYENILQNSVSETWKY